MPASLAGQPIGLEHAHLRPAQAEGITDGVVDFPDRRNAVMDQPEGLAPKRFLQPVGDEGVDLLAHHQRLHAKTRIDRTGAFDRFRRRPAPGGDLHQRQQINGVERMPDQHPFRVLHMLLQDARQQSGGRGRDDGSGRGGRVDFRKNPALEVEPLGHAFLNKAGAFHGLSERSRDAERAGGGARIAEQPVEGALGIVHRCLHRGAGIRSRVVERHVDPAQHEAGRPAAADQAAADAGCALDAAGHGALATAPRFPQRFLSISRSRTASGPSTRTPMFSAMAAVRRTRSALVARTPLSSQILSSSPTLMLPPASTAIAA